MTTCILNESRDVQERAARDGFDWPSPHGVLEKLHEEMQELHNACTAHDVDNIHEELGDMFFTLVNLARHYNMDAAACMADANEKFTRRYTHMRDQAAREQVRLSDESLTSLEQRWQAAKYATRQP